MAIPPERVTTAMGFERYRVVQHRGVVRASSSALAASWGAAEVDANVIIAMRYDADEVAPRVTDVVAYGTAVVIEPAGPVRVLCSERYAQERTP